MLPLVERLKLVAQLWVVANGRSLGALSTIVANHGSLFERLEVPGAGTTTATLEKFARFLSEAGNWPEGAVPDEVCRFAHAVGISAGACALSPDIGAEVIVLRQAQDDRATEEPVPEVADCPSATASGRPPSDLGNKADGSPAAAALSLCPLSRGGAAAAGDGFSEAAE